MTLDEKLEQMLGMPRIVQELPQCFGARHVDGIPSLQIPTLRITNGPVGVGQNDCVPPDTPGLPLSALTNVNSAPATAIPSALGVAASFDVNVATAFGTVAGTEARNLALQVLEAPGMNLDRVPQGGRNFEYLGEDPLLSGTMAVNEIRAIQSFGVIAMAKHFVANEQETNRLTIEEIIDDRVLHELYLLPFEMSVKDGDVASAMCSYNSVNGPSMCQNKHLLTDVLRGQWGFKGYVQSDFFAIHSLAPTLLAGLDHKCRDWLSIVPRWSVLTSPLRTCRRRLRTDRSRCPISIRRSRAAIRRCFGLACSIGRSPRRRSMRLPTARSRGRSESKQQCC